MDKKEQDKNSRRILKGKKTPEFVPGIAKYSSLEKRAAKELYYQLGENRSLEKVYRILNINISSLKAWSTEEKWKEWSESRQEEDERLALQGKYSTQILGLNAKAKAVLEDIIERGSKKMGANKLDIRGSDVINAAKELVRLEEADKTPDLLNSAMTILMVVDKAEYKKKKEEMEIKVEKEET